MGNHRFKLSDMMPNFWFYKLTDMRRATTRAQTKHPSKRILHHPKTTTKPPILPPPNPFPQPNRPSYYFPSRDQTEKPSHSPAHPKSSKKTRKKPNKPSPNPLHNSSSSASATNIIIDIKSLPPILTKPAKKNEAGKALHRIKVRPSSPKLEMKKLQCNRSRRMANSNLLEESFAVVKKSADPQRDFRESMVEMIIENDIRASKDLEELLACYLTLNSDEYHGLIVKVFEEIWCDLAEVRV